MKPIIVKAKSNSAIYSVASFGAFCLLDSLMNAPRADDLVIIEEVYLKAFHDITDFNVCNVFVH